MLVEVVSSWEEEELLSYGAFVQQLKDLRDRSDQDRDFPKAVLADEKTANSVRIMTIHAAKGLEFPLVFSFRILYLLMKASETNEWLDTEQQVFS